MPLEASPHVPDKAGARTDITEPVVLSVAPDAASAMILVNRIVAAGIDARVDGMFSTGGETAYGENTGYRVFVDRSQLEVAQLALTREDDAERDAVSEDSDWSDDRDDALSEAEDEDPTRPIPYRDPQPIAFGALAAILLVAVLGMLEVARDVSALVEWRGVHEADSAWLAEQSQRLTGSVGTVYLSVLVALLAFARFLWRSWSNARALRLLGPASSARKSTALVFALWFFPLIGARVSTLLWNALPAAGHDPNGDDDNLPILPWAAGTLFFFGDLWSWFATTTALNGGDLRIGASIALVSDALLVISAVLFALVIRGLLVGQVAAAERLVEPPTGALNA